MNKLIHRGIVLLAILVVLICFHFTNTRVTRLERIVQKQQRLLNNMRFVTDTQLERERWILEEVKAIIDKHFATKLFIPVKKNVFISVETKEEQNEH